MSPVKNGGKPGKTGPDPTRPPRDGVGADAPAAATRTTAPAPSADSENKSQPEVQDAWADYEEDANDWALTDAHAMPHARGAATGASPGPGYPGSRSAPVAPLAHGVAAPAEAAAAVPAGGAHVAALRPAAVENLPVASRELPTADGYAVLEGVAGQDAGRNWPIAKALWVRGRIRLGRGADNDVVLGDASISRQHAELRRQGAAWEIIDRGSGNGTFVAGARTTQAAFVPGQVLGLGHGTYRLNLAAVSPEGRGAAMASMPGGDSASSSLIAARGRPALRQLVQQALHNAAQTRWGRQRFVSAGRPVWLLWGVGVAIILAGAGSFWHLLRRWDFVGPLHTAKFALYLDGVAALNARAWPRAQGAFAALVRANPQSSEARAYLNAARQAPAKEALWSEVQRDEAAGHLPEAWAGLAQLDETMWHNEALPLRRHVNAAVTERLIRTHAALEAGHVQQAVDLLDEVERIGVLRPDAALLRSRARATIGVLASGVPSPTAARAADRVRRAGRTPSRPALGPVAEAIDDFNDGNVEAALQRLRGLPGAQARRTASAVQEFSRTFEAGLAEHRGKRAFNAIAILTRARAEHVQIGGGQGRLGASIEAKLADMYYVLGMQAYAQGRFGEAGEAWRQALVRVPGHALSRRKLEELDAHARALVDQADAIKAQDTEKARSLLREVAQMVPPTSQLAVHARHMLVMLR